MPPKNSIKPYVENGYYHVYNRGVEKRIVFLDERDYKTFLFFLKSYLDPNERVRPDTGLHNPMNLSEEVELFAFCLMPNHYHLLLHQKTKDGMSKLMKRLATHYSIYFNKRYTRVGPLFQGIYKGVLIDSDPYLLHVSRYIHRNPIELVKVDPSQRINLIASYPYSSYGDYRGQRLSAWVKPQFILNYFSSERSTQRNKFHSYAAFVEEREANDEQFLGDLCIDQEEEDNT